jgi:hypothetical protein
MSPHRAVGFFPLPARRKTIDAAGLSCILGANPGYFLAPYATSLRPVDLGEDFTVDQLAGSSNSRPRNPTCNPESHWWPVVRDSELVGWRNLYLIGLALLLAAYAVRRSGHCCRRRLKTDPGAAPEN